MKKVHAILTLFLFQNICLQADVINGSFTGLSGDAQSLIPGTIPEIINESTADNGWGAGGTADTIFDNNLRFEDYSMNGADGDRMVGQVWTDSLSGNLDVSFDIVDAFTSASGTATVATIAITVYGQNTGDGGDIHLGDGAAGVAPQWNLLDSRSYDVLSATAGSTLTESFTFTTYDLYAITLEGDSDLPGWRNPSVVIDNVTVTSAIPEPATICMMALSGLMILVVNCRRK